MESELVVDVSKHEISIALLEDKRLVELQKESRGLSYSVGDIYLGRVRKLMPGLNAAFIDIGYEKDAFLHYLDLGTTFLAQNKYFRQLISDRKSIPSLAKVGSQPELPKVGSITDHLKVGQEILVQITKEPISSKGPRLTTEISFAGRFLVLIPFNDKVSVSQKIKSKQERVRLKQQINSLREKNLGVIARTVAESKTAEELDFELKMLVSRWHESIQRIQKGKLPSLIYEETGRTVGTLRDLFNPTFKNIHINDSGVFNQVKEYVSMIAPEKENIVEHYKGEIPIFDHFSITKQIKSLLGSAVTFKRGAYLVIEHTEALHVIDVNSGNRAKAGNSQEENALDVNLAAAEEIARQLRLRDMGGIIVIDFIDMNDGSHRQMLLDHMKELMQYDRAKHNILPLSKFGLMQITRQRVRPAIDLRTSEECPVCFGKGKIQSSILFTDQLESKVDYMVTHLKMKKFKLFVHPYVEAFLRKGLVSQLFRWKVNYSWGIRLIPDQSLPLLGYRFEDHEANEVDLKEEYEMK